MKESVQEKQFKYNQWYLLWLCLYGIFFCGFVEELNSQSQGFIEQGRKVRLYNHHDGLKNSQIPDVIQSKNGYIWFINVSKLIRYDGIEFKEFYLPNEFYENNKWINFWELFEDDKGNIWIGNLNAILWKFDPLTEQFEQIDLLVTQPVHRNNYNVGINGQNGDLIIGNHYGFFQLSSDDSIRINHFAYDDLKKIHLSVLDSLDKTQIDLHGGFKDMRRNIPFKDAQGNYWAGSTHGMFFKVNYHNQALEFKEIHNTSNSRNNSSWDVLESIAECDENHLWLTGYRTTTKKEQYFIGLLNKQTGVFEEYKSGLSSEIRIRVIKQDSKNNLWIGTEEGLFVIPSDNFSGLKGKNPKAIRYYLEAKEKNESSTNASIRAITEDDFGNIWVGTFNSYLYQINAQKEPLEFTSFKEFPIYEKGGHLEFMYEDTKENVWLAVYKKGMIKYNTKEKKLTYFKNEFKGFPINYLAAIYEYLNEDLLFGGLPQHLIHYNPKTDKAIKKHLPFIGKEEQIVLSIEISPDLLMLSDGIINAYLVDKRNLQLIHHFPYVSKMYKGIGNHIWVDHHRNSENLSKYKVSLEGVSLMKTISQTNTVEFFEDENLGFWTGGYNGLQFHDFTDSTRIFYTESNGLINNTIGEIFEDNGTFWLFTFKGISKFNIKDKSFKNYNELASIELLASKGAVIKNKKRQFKIIGEDGFYTFHPDSLKEDRVPPILEIQNITVNNEKLRGIAKNEVFQLGLLSLNHAQNDLMLDYVGINFKNAIENQYQYQLEGFQKDWQKVGTDRTARFSNLPHGDYTFKVKAANADGIWSQPKELKIVILPPWWKTWWAYTLYMLATVGAFAWYINSLRKKVQQKQEQLEKELAFNDELTLLNQANQKFVPQDILTILGKKSIKDLQLGDQIRTQMTVLFSDIRDYTPLSESMTPEQNFKFINAYLGRVGPIIKAHGGFISSYLGDGFMALFVNEPSKAVQATIAIQKELYNYNQERMEQGRKALKTGMGLNTGDLMMGVIGDKNRYESTVISDAVNTASRMEGLTKIFGAAIILSEKTLAGLLDNFPLSSKLREEKKLLDNGKLSSNKSPDFAYRYLGKVKVKGKDKAIKIYDLYEGETVQIRELKAQTKLKFEEGINNYFNREFGKAAECFKQVLLVNKTDKAAQYYLDKSVHYIVNGVAKDWSGVEEMVMK